MTSDDGIDWTEEGLGDLGIPALYRDPGVALIPHKSEPTSPCNPSLLGPYCLLQRTAI